MSFLKDLFGPRNGFQAAQKMKNKGDIKGLLRLFKNPKKRKYAVQALEQLSDPSKVDLLIPFLQSGDITTRQDAAMALGGLGGIAVAEMLIEAHSLEELIGIGPIYQALIKMGRSAVDALEAALHDKRENVAAVAICVLGDIEEELAVEPLLTLLSHPSPYIRLRVIRALGNIKDSRAAAALISGLDDEHVVGNIPEAQSLRYRRDSLRLEVIKALGLIADPQARPILESITKDGARSNELRTAAKEALFSLDTPWVQADRAARAKWNELVVELIALCDQNPASFAPDAAAGQRVREIGQQILEQNTAKGLEKAQAYLARARPDQAENIARQWDDIIPRLSRGAVIDIRTARR